MSGLFQILCEALPLATAVMVVALCLSRRRHLPATRSHQVVMVACLLCLLSPLLVGLMPKWQVLPAIPAALGNGLPALPGPASPPSAPAYPLWFRALGGLWAVGLAAGLVDLGRQLLQFRTLWREAAPAPRELEGLLARLARRRGITRPIRLRIHPTLESACTWGVRRPIILIPRGEAALLPGELRMVLDHELAHIERLDAASGWLLQIFATCYWFHPCARRLTRQAELLKERACDDLVIIAGQHPAAYAARLGSTALRGTRTRHLPRFACTFARRHPLLARLDAILDQQQARSRPSPEETFRAVTPLTILAVLLASLGFKAASEAQPQSPAWIASAPDRPVPSLWSDVIEPVAAVVAGLPAPDRSPQVPADPRSGPVAADPPRVAAVVAPRPETRRPTIVAGLGKPLRSIPSRPPSPSPALSAKGPRLQAGPPSRPPGGSPFVIGDPSLPPASSGAGIAAATGALDWVQVLDDEGIELQIKAPTLAPDGESLAFVPSSVESTDPVPVELPSPAADPLLTGLVGITGLIAEPELLPVHSEAGEHFAISVEVPALDATAWSAEASTDARIWTASEDIVEQSILPGTTTDTVRIQAAVTEPARSSRYRYLRLKADW